MSESELYRTTGPMMGRRSFLRTAAGAGALAVGASALPDRYSPIGRAEALVPVGVAVLAYLTMRVAENHTGQDYDETAYTDAQNDEIHTRVIEQGAEMQYYDDQTFTQIGNLLENSRQVAYGDARYAAIEAMNLGDTETEVTNKAEAVVDEFFAIQQKNLLDHFSVQRVKLSRLIGEVDGFLNTRYDNDSGVYATHADGTLESSPHQWMSGTSVVEYTLVDGNPYSYETAKWYNNYDSSERVAVFDSNDSGNSRIFKIYPVSTGDHQVLFDHFAYQNMMADIETAHSDTIAEIQTFITNVYPNYTAGEIDLADVVQPGDLAAMAYSENDTPLAGADLAVMGLKANTNSRMTVLLENSGVAFDGTIYMKSDGTTTELQTGETYDPDSFSGPVWLAYQNYSVTSGSDYDGSNLAAQDVIEVDEPFTVLEVTDSTGADLSSVTFEDEAGQSTTTTDITELNNELNRLQELQNELIQQQEDIIASSDDGGGGFSISDFSLLGLPGAVVVGAGGALALVLGLNQSG